MFEAISLVIPLDPKNELKIINEIIICSLPIWLKTPIDFALNYKSLTKQVTKLSH